jgi:hypothetical protein
MGGYAAALKKQPKTVAKTNDSSKYTTSADKQQTKSSGKSTSQLEQDLSKLKVSNTAETEHEFWEAEDEAPEVW